MFLDLVLSFCCSKIQKDDKDANSLNSNNKEQEKIIEYKKIQLDIEKGSPGQIQISSDSSAIVSPSDNQFQLNCEQEQEKGIFEEDNIGQKLFDIQQDEELQLNNNLVQDHFLQRSKPLEKQEKDLKKKINKKKQNLNGYKRVVKIWKPEEDQRLRNLYQEHKGSWNKIIQSMSDRNISQCSQRWRRINPKQVNQLFYQNEDKKLVSMVALEGKNWTNLARHFLGRTGKQIRNRYLNKLDPNLNFVPWTDYEDQEIVKCYNQYGAKWSLVASHLKGRSENMVKNRFYSHIQKHLLGRQNKYQIIFKQGNNQEQQNGISQMIEGNKNKEIEYSETSNNDMKFVNSENYSVIAKIPIFQSSIGQSTFTFYYYENIDFEGNQEVLTNNIQFDHKFNEKP